MTNKLKYFIANWKMYGDLSSIKILKKVDAFLKKNKKFGNKKIISCIPSNLIHPFSLKLKNSSISIGAQNCHFKERYGPYTGALSAFMLKKVGAKYVILGHSENRKEGDNNQLIKQKIKNSLNQDLTVILCIGETIEEKRNNKTFSILRKQIDSSLDKKINFKRIIIAYEPVWSIGTNKIPKISNLRKIMKFIKNHLRKKFDTLNVTKVVYGGSVNSKNVSVFSKISEIDGFLVGGASQSSRKFVDIIKNYYK